jgi:hypothetical protein
MNRVEEEHRIAIELFIKALGAKPDLCNGEAEPEKAAQAIVKGADIIWKYLIEGKLPTP